ncbi:hypothetical protein Dip518_000953 [Parelusimicrobium proximum]|uniref:hypothetical protein n=1 Tax=Parelusimicrobium proximum TaxID=3228953 RepID=UPI003D17DFD5
MKRVFFMFLIVFASLNCFAKSRETNTLVNKKFAINNSVLSFDRAAGSSIHATADTSYAYPDIIAEKIDRSAGQKETEQSAKQLSPKKETNKKEPKVSAKEKIDTALILSARKAEKKSFFTIPQLAHTVNLIRQNYAEDCFSSDRMPVCEGYVKYAASYETNEKEYKIQVLTNTLLSSMKQLSAASDGEKEYVRGVLLSVYERELELLLGFEAGKINFEKAELLKKEINKNRKYITPSAKVFLIIDEMKRDLGERYFYNNGINFTKNSLAKADAAKMI